MIERPRVMVFLGAGASRFAGYYTFVGFPELLFNREIREKEGMRPLSPNPERLLRAIRDSLERNDRPTTHDNFLWRLDGYTQFLRLNQSDDVLQEFLRENTRLWDLHNCTEQAIEQITATTIHHYSAERVRQAKEASPTSFNGMQVVMGLYHSLSVLNGPESVLPIFTTNYDLLLEDLVAEFGSRENMPVRIVNGIPGVTQELAKWRPTEYAAHAGGAQTFQLHRLHGCVCWFKGNNGIEFHRRDATDQETDKLCAMYPGRETNIGTDPHGFSFRAFYAHLLVCELVIFIGFSFRDDDVMHVLLKALSERRGDLKVLVVDQVYTKTDVILKLESSTERTGFPFYLPCDGEIDSLRLSFGTDQGFDQRILDCSRKMLGLKKEKGDEICAQDRNRASYSVSG